MNKNEKLALVNTMQQIEDQKALRALSDEIFGGVIPMRREAQDDLVYSAVSLLAAGIPVYRAVDVLHTASTLKKDKPWVETLVARIIEVIAEKAKTIDSPEIDLNVAFKAAMSYAAVIDGRGNPSPELEQLAQAKDGDYNRAGTEAMMQVMRFLSEPQKFGLTPETVRLSENIAEHVHNKAMDAAFQKSPDYLKQSGDWQMLSVQVSEDDVITVEVDDGMAFKDGVHEFVIYTPEAKNLENSADDTPGVGL